MAARDPGGGEGAARTGSARCAAGLSVATTASGRSCGAGAGTCSAKAGDTRVPVAAAAMLVLATMPSRPSAPPRPGSAAADAL